MWVRRFADWQKLPAVLGAALALLSSQASLAGPPFFIDDPVPVEPGHWEINNYSAATFVRGASFGTLPGSDINYGCAENLQCHLLLPVAFSQSSGVSTDFGLGDIEIGAKYRFLPAKESDWWPQIAFYPFLDFATGNAERGLGTGATHALLPLWLEKDFGKWSTYFGGGYWINPGPGNRSFWVSGWVVQYQLTDKLMLGGELFQETSSSTAGPGTRGFPLGTKDSTGFNLGGVYDFDTTYHLLFSAGRGLQNASTTNEFSYYLALRLTY